MKDSKVMDLIRTMIDEDSMAGDPDAVVPIMRELAHCLGHLGLAGSLGLPEMTALCVEEIQEAQKCLAASMLSDILAKGLAGRADSIPDSEKN